MRTAIAAQLLQTQGSKEFMDRKPIVKVDRADDTKQDMIGSTDRRKERSMLKQSALLQIYFR
jgi:hypothetical protein